MGLWLYIIIGYFILTHLLIFILGVVSYKKGKKILVLYLLITAPLSAIIVGTKKLYGYTKERREVKWV